VIAVLGSTLQCCSWFGPLFPFCIACLSGICSPSFVLFGLLVQHCPRSNISYEVSLTLCHSCTAGHLSHFSCLITMSIADFWRNCYICSPLK
jgi:hypothetical protein